MAHLPGCTQLFWSTGFWSVVCPGHSLSFSQPSHAADAVRKQHGKPVTCFWVGRSPQVLPASFLLWTETKGLQSSLRCFIWLVSNKYHSADSKFLQRTIYGQFTAWRINAITELKYFRITKLKKLCSAFRETTEKKEAAFIAWPLLANSCKEGEAKATPALPPGICYRVCQVSGVCRAPGACPGALRFPEFASP